MEHTIFNLLPIAFIFLRTSFDVYRMLKLYVGKEKIDKIVFATALSIFLYLSFQLYRGTIFANKAIAENFEPFETSLISIFCLGFGYELTKFMLFKFFKSDMGYFRSKEAILFIHYLGYSSGAYLFYVLVVFSMLFLKELARIW